MATFNREWLSQIPSPGFSDDRAFQSGLRRLGQRGREDLATSWYWSYRLAGAMEGIAPFLAAQSRTTRIASGFIEERNGEFGVIVYTESAGGDPKGEPLPDTSIQVGGVSFPVVVRETVAEQHWCGAPEVLAPMGARATCWVEEKARRHEGWLLPRHAPGGRLTSTVKFSDGGLGSVVDCFGECIDAVVVDSSHPHPKTGATAACFPLVAGQSLEVSDAPHSHQSLTVVDVDLNLGVIVNQLFPIRYTTDWTGVSGQSGALMVEPRGPEPAGLYLGTLTPTNTSNVAPRGVTPTTFGYGLACHQLESSTGMEFYL